MRRTAVERAVAILKQYGQTESNPTSDPYWNLETDAETTIIDVIADLIQAGRIFGVDIDEAMRSAYDHADYEGNDDGPVREYEVRWACRYEATSAKDAVRQAIAGLDDTIRHPTDGPNVFFARALNDPDDDSDQLILASDVGEWVIPTVLNETAGSVGNVPRGTPTDSTWRAMERHEMVGVAGRFSYNGGQPFEMIRENSKDYRSGDRIGVFRPLTPCCQGYGTHKDGKIRCSNCHDGIEQFFVLSWTAQMLGDSIELGLLKEEL